MAGTGFRIDDAGEGSRATLVVTGELDSGTSPALLEAFERAAAGLAGGQPAAEHVGGELHLDLSGLSFTDSAGLRAIIQIEQAARERGLGLLVSPPPAPITELLEVVGVADRLTFVTHQGEMGGFQPFLERVELELPAEPEAPSQARAEIRQAAQALDPRTLDAAVLLTSEIVTNAVIHPQTRNGYRVGLRVTCFETGIRCEVTDPGAGFDPASLAPRELELGGRGLLLVDALSSRWGADFHRVGGEERFCVWFELDASEEAAASGVAGG